MNAPTRPSPAPFDFAPERRKEILNYLTLDEVGQRALQAILGRIDPREVAILRKVFDDEVASSREQGQSKYADIVYWICQKVYVAQSLGLHRQSPKKVLDIGTGGGYFLAALREFGHDAVGTDVTNKFYQAIADLLRVDRRISPIVAGQPQPDHRVRFDLITIHWPGFDVHRASKSAWGIEEWAYVLHDLTKHHLTRGGMIHVMLNRHGIEGGQTYSSKLIEWAAGCGATGSFRRGELRFQSVPARCFLRTSDRLPTGLDRIFRKIGVA